MEVGWSKEDEEKALRRILPNSYYFPYSTLYSLLSSLFTAMHYAITWWTWFLWKALIERLLSESNQVTVIGRSEEKIRKVFGDRVWALERKNLSQSKLVRIEVCINLSWATLFRFPWSRSYKKTIYDSRILTTNMLVKALPSSCHTFISWSEIGYYPSSETKEYTTTYINTTPTSFLENTCIDREQAASLASSPSRRVVLLRTWLIQWKQWMKATIKKLTHYLWWIIPWSWKQRLSTISTNQRVDNVITCVNDRTIQWPVNLVQNQLHMDKYIHTLANTLHRPVWWWVPEYIIKLLLWSMSEIVLWSQYVVWSFIKDKVK